MSSASSCLLQSISPGWREFASKASLPSGATLMVVDSEGIVLAGWPEPDRWRGKSVDDKQTHQLIKRGVPDTAEVRGSDGTRLLVAFAPLGPQESHPRRCKDQHPAKGCPRRVHCGPPAESVLVRVRRIARTRRRMVWRRFIRPPTGACHPRCDPPRTSRRSHCAHRCSRKARRVGATRTRVRRDDCFSPGEERGSGAC